MLFLTHDESSPTPPYHLAAYKVMIVSIGFGLYQFWRNMGKVGSVFWLQWCGWASWARDWESGWCLSVCVVSLDYLC